MGALSSHFLCLFDIFLSFFECFLPFWHNNIIPGSSNILLPKLWDQSVFQGALAPARGGQCLWGQDPRVHVLLGFLNPLLNMS